MEEIRDKWEEWKKCECDECDEYKKHERDCIAVATQHADVSLPVTVKPCARVKSVETKCCGEPVVCMKNPCGHPCPGVCEFVITQGIAVKVEVEFSAEAEAGKPCAVCRRPTVEE